MGKRTGLIISFCIGGIVGVVLVRAFFLDGLEEFGWRMFWEGLGNGRMMDPGMVLQSTTFLKCVGGLVIGGALGALITHMRWNKVPKQAGSHGD
ncbi:exported hypothetical protein [Candidatus Sulfotelmatobacter kueseliae]|uniref:Uncharacterized protein n=1 Tax=Candidatus Sulfotelmatobacter kueseliae TaxID=2042962 RepID=A0A2U3LA34_9BACT|nr:exported hypothetical protein [Candidatus Sulfotelmatobacter kueseliae]